MRKHLFFLAMLSFLCCKPDTGSDVDTTLDIRIKSDPQKINPMLSLNQVSRFIHQYIYLPLADFHPETLKLYPILIQEIPSRQEGENGNYHYNLAFKSDAQWQDGTPLGSADYDFTIKFMSLSSINSSAYSSIISSIDKVEVVTEKEVQVTYDEPFIHALEAAINIPILPRHLYDPQDIFSNYSLEQIRAYANVEDLPEELMTLVEAYNGTKFTRDMLTNAGPYELVSWETDQNIVLKKVENFWGKAYPDNPFLQQGPEEMIFYIVPDATTALSMVKDGSIDISNEIPTNEFLSLKENEVYADSLQFYATPMMRYYFLQLNHAHPVLQDVKVRKALNYLLDVDGIISSLEGGMGTRLHVPVHPAKRYYADDLPQYVKDISKATTLMKEAGWSDSDGDGDLDKVVDGKMTDCKIEMYITKAALGRNIGLILQEACREIGIELELITKDFSTIREQHLKTRDYGITTAVASLDLEDDDFYLQWHSDNDSAAGRNRSSYNNKLVDDLIEKIKSASDYEAREPLYDQIQDLFYQDALGLFLYAPMEKLIINKRWSGEATVKRPGYLANTFTPGN